MIGQTKLSKARAYSVAEIPVFNIDYRGLVEYARKTSRSVPELSDEEKNRFIIGATMDDIKRHQLIV